MHRVSEGLSRGGWPGEVRRTFYSMALLEELKGGQGSRAQRGTERDREAQVGEVA